VKARIVSVLLRVYGRVSRSGVFNRPLPRRAFESAYLAYKRLEAGPVSQLRVFVPTGTTAIDVGANIGFFSLRFARWVGPTGRVIAIEPEERNVAALRRRLARARLEGVVECEQAVAADKPGELRLAVNELHPGDHHIAADGIAARAITVDALTADDSRAVSLLKVDVQGAEQLVLAGARQTIETHRPAIFIELDNEALERQGASADALVGLLSDLGYRGHLLARKGISEAQEPASLVARSETGYIDVLFLHAH
jgi:FkbM family methyltransferase